MSPRLVCCLPGDLAQKEMEIVRDRNVHFIHLLGDQHPRQLVGRSRIAICAARCEWKGGLFFGGRGRNAHCHFKVTGRLTFLRIHRRAL